ncbi:putative Myb family transcription factor [Acorus calamus]|uniref:Myb family transcription factor n=1 Tax=Acorus calamus TaxID=4465 RepID=A0AAV9C451_ACOCL|nr:putative Myb family transcription factor [Acorus calamus]
MMRRQGRSETRRYSRSELPRLRWTSELHKQFVEAVECLGGENKATPKRILKVMGVKDLSISHVKSHLQNHESNIDEGVPGGFCELTLSFDPSLLRGCKGRSESASSIEFDDENNKKIGHSKTHNYAPLQKAYINLELTMSTQPLYST